MIADMTKNNESVRFAWNDNEDKVVVVAQSGDRPLRNDKIIGEEMVRAEARKRWKELKTKGFIPIIVTGKDDIGHLLGTLPDGSTVTEFPGGGWVVPVPSRGVGMYEIVC